MALDHDPSAANDQGAKATSDTKVATSEADRYLRPPLPRPASTEPTSNDTAHHGHQEQHGGSQRAGQGHRRAPASSRGRPGPNGRTGTAPGPRGGRACLLPRAKWRKRPDRPNGPVPSVEGNGQGGVQNGGGQTPSLRTRTGTSGYRPLTGRAGGGQKQVCGRRNWPTPRAITPMIPMRRRPGGEKLELLRPPGPALFHQLCHHPPTPPLREGSWPTRGKGWVSTFREPMANNTMTTPKVAAVALSSSAGRPGGGRRPGRLRSPAGSAPGPAPRRRGRGRGGAGKGGRRRAEGCHKYRAALSGR